MEDCHRAVLWERDKPPLVDKSWSILTRPVTLGCAYFSELEVGRNARYTSHRMIDEFVAVLSECVEQQLLSKVRASPAIGILCDESTDSANMKQLVMLVRYLFEGKPYTSFLKVADIEDGKASTISQSLLSILRGVKFQLRLFLVLAVMGQL